VTKEKRNGLQDRRQCMLGGRIERKKERKKEKGATHTKTEVTKVATLLIKLQASNSSSFAFVPASSQSLFFG
jgi:hypothetical protein